MSGPPPRGGRSARTRGSAAQASFPHPLEYQMSRDLIEGTLPGITARLRVDHEAEREGLDLSAHGESAYQNWAVRQRGVAAHDDLTTKG